MEDLKIQAKEEIKVDKVSTPPSELSAQVIEIMKLQPLNPFTPFRFSILPRTDVCKE